MAQSSSPQSPTPTHPTQPPAPTHTHHPHPTTHTHSPDPTHPTTPIHPTQPPTPTQPHTPQTTRSTTPWLIVSGHRPFYIASTNNWWPAGDQPAAEEARGALERLFFEAGVDLTLHGHHHSYQRTCPAFEGRCRGVGADGSAAAPVHLVIGHAGASLSTNVPLAPAPIWEVCAWGAGWGVVLVWLWGVRLEPWLTGYSPAGGN